MLVFVFVEGGKGENPEKNLSEQGRELTTNSAHMTSTPGIESGPHWWEASALTTVPSCTFFKLNLTNTDFRQKFDFV